MMRRGDFSYITKFTPLQWSSFARGGLGILLPLFLVSYLDN